MKTIKSYITEGIFKNIGAVKAKPKTKDELIQLIKQTMKTEGPNCDLNFIDTSLIVDMSYLFYSIYDESKKILSIFNGDISQWDVSNVTDMRSMFRWSKFNGDISNWDISNVTNMCAMFANSKFNGDISKWNTSNVTNMADMFQEGIFNGDISKWNTSKVVNMNGMFRDNKKFNGDISKWNTSSLREIGEMFQGSIFNRDISGWDTSRVWHMRDTFKDSNFNQDISNWKIAYDTTDPIYRKKIRVSIMGMFEDAHKFYPGNTPKWILDDPYAVKYAYGVKASEVMKRIKK